METLDSRTAIPADEIIYHPASFADPGGRLFWWRGDLYRGVSAEAAPLCRELFASGVVERLVSRGLLVETDLTAYRVGAYPLVLRHRVVPFVSYAYEWCAEMLRDAAAVVLDLQQELATRGLTLQDAHAWNVMFDGSRPVWVDFGSIVRSGGGPWVARDEFRQFFLNPLRLMAVGHGRIARWLLHDTTVGVLDSEVRALRSTWPGEAVLQRVIGRVAGAAKAMVPAAVLSRARRARAALRARLLRALPRRVWAEGEAEQLRRDLDAIGRPRLGGAWGEYYGEKFPPFSPSEAWTAKHRGVHDILAGVQPSSLLDIGSNRGWFAQLAAHRGTRVVALDVDEASLTQLYLESREKTLPILPLLMDVRNPSPGLGLDNSWLPAATARLRCDMVLALALVHHLVFTQHLNFEQIVGALGRFSNRWLVVEFISAEDRYVRDWWVPRFAWYTLDNFLAALRQRFHVLKVQPSHPAGRELVLCEVRRDNWRDT